MPLYEFGGKSPDVAPSAFVHPEAILIGNVIVGEKCFIGAGAVLRGDYGTIVIGNGSNVQENCVLHSQPDTTALIEENVDIGHGAIIHGPGAMNSNVTIGMGAIICEGYDIGTGSFIGAGSLLTPNTSIPPYKLAAGNPAKIIKDVGERHRVFHKIAVTLYQNLCESYRNSLKLIEK